MAGAPAPKLDVAVDRAKQLFRFLQAFAQLDVPIKRRISDQPWSLRFADLPADPSISIGEVLIARAGEASTTEQEPERDTPLLQVRRPKPTKPPTPSAPILEWLQPGWEDPSGRIDVIRERNIGEGQETVTVGFANDPMRVQALDEWMGRWNKWAEAERPVRAAMKVFERLYELRGRIQLESERVELMLGDGRLRMKGSAGEIDHPVLLQRVELEFDANVPEFRLIDADRPPELYGAILHEGEGISSDSFNKLRAELESSGYHPLAKDLTSGYLKRLVQQLGAHGRFREDATAIVPGPDPIISRDPILYLRSRESGYPAAFARILEDLEGGALLPVSLTRLVGVEPPATNRDLIPETSPWGEPPDVLLSKPANLEQIEIARALERHGAVLVQGPPGTGKSHTIANLIGHLVAHGKRVLVTSHTTKALRVLRDQIVDTIRPLSVAVLENDQKARQQMEQAVSHIVSRLSTSREDTLEREVTQYVETRMDVISTIEGLTRDLRSIREIEYQPLVLAGEPIPPSEASRWVKENQAGNDWIPGAVEFGVPVALSLEELEELYGTQGQVSYSEEAEVSAGLPEVHTLPDPTAFDALVQSLTGMEPHDASRFWMHSAAKDGLPALHRLRELVVETSRDLGSLAPWERHLVGVGHGNTGEGSLWRALNDQVREAVARWEKARPILLEHDPELAPGLPEAEVPEVLREVLAHVARGGSLSGWSLLFRPKWKRLIEASRVNGKPPRTGAHFKALMVRVALDDGRNRLRQRWTRQGEPCGLPSFESCGPTPEPVLQEYASQFESLLNWWQARWTPIVGALADAGFRWEAFRQHEVAKAAPAVSFERDAGLLAGPLQSAVIARLSHAISDQAQSRLAAIEGTLELHRGPRCRELLESVRKRDSARFSIARNAVLDLLTKQVLWRRRKELLKKLAGVAPEWAGVISRREGVHGSAKLPGELGPAWRWRQLTQETTRRAELDERKLTKSLHQCRAELREVTAQLIDRLAWLGQLRRTSLAARQALQGWVQTQRKIGKGTGKRVPELQAQARKLLAQSRGSVPVWIMPLNRVAEAFDPVEEKFDVVIVDEASQADPLGLLCWYMGKQIAVVGDHEQVSPLAVGQKVTSTQVLINEHLGAIPNHQLYDGKTSIYDLARTCFGGEIGLLEHFRCMPEIIEYSNQLSYQGQIKPLRNPASAPRPHVVEYVVAEAVTRREGKTNPAEARVVSALVKALSEMPECADKSMGAISLLGDEQAGLIQDLTVGLVGAVELERRRFIAGNSAQFQGDERDLMFLSMVDSTTGAPLRMTQADLFKQRYNVAASRARDQLWLIHSLDPGRDLQVGDLRRGLIEHVRDPGAKQRAMEVAQRRAESPFEIAVIGALVSAGYRVQPQVWVGRYRLDMVVSDDRNQVALECDGDRFHGVDQIPADMTRQAVLERAGWTFIRIRGTRFFRDQERAMAWIFEELSRAGVRPMGAEVSGPLVDESARGFREKAIRRVHEIMREQGWLPPIEPTTLEGLPADHSA